MNDYIDNVFGPGGVLARRFEGYTPRPAQIELARAVDAALADGRHLMAEAPPGTGKSISYCIPATYHAAHHERRVVIATANIALQEQLVGKDLPLLAELLPWRFEYALLKGKSNYLCHDRLGQEKADGTLDLVEDPADREMLDELIAWACSPSTGDVSELPFQPPHRLWRRFSTTSDGCTGKECPSRDKCCWFLAREAAQNAQVVVCNYHLLFAHLQVREATGRNLVLPPFNIAILDEAHKAAEIARDFFGFRVTAGSVRWATRLLVKADEWPLQEAVADEARRFFADLDGHRRSAAYRSRLRRADVVPSSRLCELLGKATAVYALQGDPEMHQAATRCRTLATQIREAMMLADPGSVAFIEEDARGNAVLQCKPIDVADRLQRSLFDCTHSVVLTSATLTTDGAFDHIAKEVGVPDPRRLTVESPFDFSRQALLVVPSDMPAPNAPDYPEAVADAFADVIELAEGRTLGLFTSYRNLNTAYERVQGNGHRVLRQGDMPRTALVEEFRRDVRSVLLGTESFWAGVDVPGEALSCVVIDRLPFPSPDDAVLDAISEHNRQWFRSYSLPRAVIAFKQGFGRLIRSASDRGVVVVLDRRLVTKTYGRVFTASLPDMLKSRRIQNVRRFLEEAA